MAIVTNAGGPGILAADALEDQGLELPELSAGLREKIGAKLPVEASTHNPVDLIASGGPEEFEMATKLILESGEVDSLIVIYVPTSPEGASNVANALRRCQAAYEGPVTLLSVFMDAEGAGLKLARTDGTRSIPTYLFPEHAALALARAVRHGQWRRRDPGYEGRLESEGAAVIRSTVEKALERLGPEGGWLEPEEVDACLGAAGLRTPTTAVVQTPEDALEAAREVGGPVALKVISKSALHKSDVGGVVLDVEGDEEVAAAYEKVAGSVADVEGVMVQEFVSGGHELLVGMVTDPNFGPIVGVGLGGFLVELVKDLALRIHPITDTDAAEMLRETKAMKLLEGYRNQPKGDVQALEEALQRVSGLIHEAPELMEMDLNPVLVLEPGEGICVVDARMRIEPVDPVDTFTMRDLPGVTSPAAV